MTEWGTGVGEGECVNRAGKESERVGDRIRGNSEWWGVSERER